jgi:glycerophosphoryl diester phosphodiesterase
MARFPGILAAILLTASTAQAFDLQGHRGARGLAPENTLAGFSAALATGVTTLELDLGISKDGVMVVHHDLWLNPDITRGADGAFLSERGPAIRTLTLAELKTYDVGRLKSGTAYAQRFPGQRAADGARIPALSEVFELAKRHEDVRFNIETKLTPGSGADTADPETFAAAVAGAVRQAGLASRVSVQSFDWRTLVALRRIAPEIERVCLTSEGAGFDTIQRGQPGPSPWTAGLDIDDAGGSTPKLVAAAACAFWSPAYRDLTRDALAAARAIGLKVIPWTVNVPADMEALIDMGVDGIITDYPDRLRAVLAARKMPLPKPVAGN